MRDEELIAGFRRTPTPFFPYCEFVVDNEQEGVMQCTNCGAALPVTKKIQPHNTWKICSGMPGVKRALPEQHNDVTRRIQIAKRGRVDPRTDFANTPRVAVKVARAGLAMARWILAGRPMRSAAEQRRILNTVCPNCPAGYYDNGNCHKCGCVLRRKVMMDTEECPLTPPAWVAHSGPIAEERDRG